MNDNTEPDIRNLIEGWAKAVRAKEIEGVLAHHADDMVMFDVPPPVIVEGIDAYRETWPEFFKWHEKPRVRSISCRSISRPETTLRSRPPCCAVGRRRN